MVISSLPRQREEKVIVMVEQHERLADHEPCSRDAREDCTYGCSRAYRAIFSS
jgi:hypothetical protein